jgi:hypothetical protein
MEDWRKAEGHPCIPYMVVWEQKQREKKQREDDAFNDFLKKKPHTREQNEKQIHIYPKKFPSREVDEGKVFKPQKKPEPPEKPQKPEKKRTLSNKFIRLGIFIAILLLLGVLFLSITPKEGAPQTKLPSVTEISTHSVPIQISFSEYAAINDPKYAANVNLIGKLQDERIPINKEYSYMNRYLVDDYNNQIKVNSFSGDTFSAYDPLFIKNTTTTEYYNVTGILRTTRMGSSELNIEVKTITLTTRPELSVPDTVEEKQVSAVEGGYTIQLSYGFKRLKILLLGCGDGKRKYGTECITIVTCSDGTLDPDCSTNKPLQCMNGTLINNSKVCGCLENQTISGSGCRSILCSDGTREPKCSDTKPYQCINNQLILNSTKCGCPPDYKKDGAGCKKIQRCSDGTIYGECAKTKPTYCQDGKLIQKASVCGCAFDKFKSGEECISEYEVGPKQIQLYNGRIKYTVYRGLNDYLKGLDRAIWFYQGSTAPTSKDFIMKTLDNAKQKEYLDSLITKIKEISSDSDAQAKIAISLVQDIPYDWEAFNSNSVTGKYPYEVLYTNAGVCSEKSALLAYLLRGLDFSVAILRFDVESHDAVGIKCPSRYYYKNTGYCFVESTQPTTIGYVPDTYVGVGSLKSTPEVIVISEGKSLKSI